MMQWVVACMRVLVMGSIYCGMGVVLMLLCNVLVSMYPGYSSGASRALPAPAYSSSATCCATPSTRAASGACNNPFVVGCGVFTLRCLRVQVRNIDAVCAFAGFLL